MEKIKTPNIELDILSITHRGNLLEIEFPNEVNIEEIDFSSIDVLTKGGVKCTTLNGFTTVYNIDGNTVTLSNNEETHTEPENPDETEEPIEEDPVSTFEKNKAYKISLSKTMLESYLKNNPLLFADGNYYSVTQDKQSLLTSALMLYDVKSKAGLNPIFKWNSTGDTCIEMPIETGIALAIAIGDYVEPIVEQQRSIEKKINACITQEELDGVVVAYETIS